MNIKNILTESIQEKEVERFLKIFLVGTKFQGKTFAVGGYVRDEFLGLDAKDLDIVVELDGGSEGITKLIYEEFPIEVTQPFKMGNYPIWQITFKDDIEYRGEQYKTKGAVIEFADTMAEDFPDKTSRQRMSSFGTLVQDIERRDFTVNMLLKDLTTGEFRDLTGVSQSDISHGILRGHPNISLDKIFNDDPLRMIRLVRFQAKYDWEVPLSVIKTVKRNADRIEIVSPERIMAELIKVMKLGKFGKAIKFMQVAGLLPYVMPEVSALKGVSQGIHHQEGDVWKHTMMVLAHAPATIEGQLGALLHDVGKPAVRNQLEDKITFYGHEAVGARMAKEILRRLKFDNETTDKVVNIVKNHMRVHNLSKAGEKGLRKFIREVGESMTDALIDMGQADAMGRIPVKLDDYEGLRSRIKATKEKPLNRKLISGQDVMDLLHLKPGPIVRDVLLFAKDVEDDIIEQGREVTRDEVVGAIQRKFG